MNKQNFNAITIPLKGSNLIEASAGTGKTYSITLLVLRLLLEKKVDIRQILMVTFTKAAVAEMEERIRKMVRNSYDYVNSSAKIDSSLAAIIDPHLHSDKENLRKTLRDAVIHLDELAIYTIHSFSQQMLTEFAFETGQLFGVQMLADQSELVNKSANKFWRENVTLISKELLQKLNENGFNRSNYLDIVRQGMRNADWVCSDEFTPNNTLEAYKNHQGNAELVASDFKHHVERNKDDLNERIEGDSRASKAFSKLMASDNSELLLLKFTTMVDRQYIQKKFSKECEFALNYLTHTDRAKEVLESCMHFIYGEAIRHMRQSVSEMKKKQMLISFDDLIKKLNSSLVTSSRLCEQIGQKFQAAFIDEFQDTDQSQFEIFNRIFGENHPIFYIGDPKQSIYTFRGADLDTYKKATHEVDFRYSMDTNFRSTAKYVDDCNVFFGVNESPFADPEIKYEQVTASEMIKDNIYREGELFEGIKPISSAKSDESLELTLDLVKDLLSSSYKIGDRPIKPSDIAVLVRGNEQSAKVKKHLKRGGIHAVNKDETKIFETDEAQAIYYILQAVILRSRGAIHRALIGPFTDLNQQSILFIDLDIERLKFNELSATLRDRGVYACLQLFKKIYEVQSYLLAPENPLGERSLSNFTQLAELLHQTEYRKRLKADELVQWMKRNMKSSGTDDAYIQRIESDKQSITISTIHSAKGLSYPIVIAPFLNLNARVTRGKPVYYKNPDGTERLFSLTQDEIVVNQALHEQEQENRRLLYVALTRAVYLTFVFDTQSIKNSFLHESIQNLQNQGQFQFIDVTAPTEWTRPNPSALLRTEDNSFSTSISTQWTVSSFSKISSPHASKTAAVAMASNDDYDQFVFEKMPRGPHLGNFLHDLFEHCDFAAESSWPTHLKQVARKHSQVFDEQLQTQYLQLIKSVCSANIPATNQFKLAEIISDKKLPELEFYYNFNQLNTKLLSKRFPKVSSEIHGTKKGVMNGFIDLFFEHNGMYYILDWKSNYLGSDMEFYKTEALDNAMTESNYHLQYLIYTLAVHRYLKAKIPDYNYSKHFGGVIYLFLRGARVGKPSGVYFHKPSLTDIEYLDSSL